ncbi:SpoIIE family protein phosphatase [Embleya hyalina]|uniref:protein-serine/threonine phosphatase n=1 Tax=Embleya hyalina TaxID=516124 RepID=A0A401YK87_9ACTN|nr:SpoIIE family protein phosphatase [Embleya hyalina]GCD94991.1 diguanylate cyclase [Embleya hyalina]
MSGSGPGADTGPLPLPVIRSGADRDDHVEGILADCSNCLDAAVRATGAYAGVVYLRSPDRRSLVLAKVAGLAVSLLGPWSRVPVTGALPAPEAYRTGRTVFLADDGDTMRRFPQLALGMPYAYASASAPVRGAGSGSGGGNGGETFGVVTLMWPASPGRGLPAARRRGLRAAAKRLGNALGARSGPGTDIAYDGPPTVTMLPTDTFPLIRVGLFDWNVTTGDFDADEELCELFGVAPADFDRRAATLAARVVSGGGREFREAAHRAVETGRVLAWRLQVAGPDGTCRPLEVWGRIPEDETGGRARHLVGAVLDLGAGAAAAEAVERLRDGVFSLDGEGRVTYASRNLADLLGVRLEDVLGRTPWDALPWLADPAYEDRYRAAMLSQQPGSFLARTPRDRWLAFSLYPDSYGLTGKVVPVAPPPGASDAAHVAEAAPPPAAPETEAAPPRLGAIYHVLQMAGALTEAVSVGEVCEVVADQILPAFGGRELAIYVVRDERFFLALESGYPEGFLDRFEGVPLDAALPGVEALTRGVPIFIESAEELTAAYPGIPLDEMSAWAFLPLIASDRAVGSCILGFDRRHAFTPEERSVLTALSGLIAQALERARLYDAEFALARGLQHALLPHRLPTLPNLEVVARYLPGTQGMEIGGDWYDVIDTGRAVDLVIGDVEGHSVAAAGTMGQLRSAVRAFATGGQRPDEVVSCTNRLLADLDPGLFASCCYIELDPESGRAEAVRAGHPPPLLRGADGRTRVVELPGGPLLGVDRAAEYPVTRMALEPGSVLALYTDGLVEEVGVDLDRGIDRMRASLSHAADSTLSDVADRMLRDAGRLTERADDVAVLLTRRLRPIPGMGSVPNAGSAANAGPAADSGPVPDAGSAADTGPAADLR